MFLLELCTVLLMDIRALGANLGGSIFSATFLVCIRVKWLSNTGASIKAKYFYNVLFTELLWRTATVTSLSRFVPHIRAGISGVC